MKRLFLILALPLALSLATSAQTLPNAVPMPSAEVQFFDANGVPLAGGKLYTCVAGLSCPGNPQATYTDSTASVQNSNPVILDSAGRAQVWIGSLAYRLVLQDANSVQQWTQDNVVDTTLYFINFVKTAGTATIISYTDPVGNVTTVAGQLNNLYNGIFTQPGSWNDGAYQVTLNPVIGSNVNTDTMRLYATNVVGRRPSAVDGGVIIPSTATTYEADAIAGQVFNSSPLTNGVAGSFFAILNGDPWIGVCNTSSVGNTVTRVSGPAFNLAWQGATNSLFTVNSAELGIATVVDGDTLTLTSDPGNQTSVSCAKRIFLWGVNALLSDGQPGAPGAPSHDWGYLTNEWDFNVFKQHTKVVAHSIGGNGGRQPDIALGYLVNTLGSGLKWNCGFCTLDGTASVAMQIGVSSAGNNAGSQPILFFSRDNSGNASSAVMLTDANGNFLFHPGFTGPAGGNPQTLFQDAGGNNIIGVQGSMAGGLPRLQGGTRTRFLPGTTTFADLGSESGGSMVYCSDCNVVPAAPYICTGGGTGAMATRSAGDWHCPF